MKNVGVLLFACAYETADIEFELLLSQAMQKGNNLAHHLIQSFCAGRNHAGAGPRTADSLQMKCCKENIPMC